MNSQMEIDLVVLEKVTYAAIAELTPEMAVEIQYGYNAGFISDVLTCQMRTSFLTRKIHDQIVEYPANWWQHFKQRFFPFWAIKRWPILTTKIVVTTWHDYMGLKPINGVYPTPGFTQEIIQ